MQGSFSDYILAIAIVIAVYGLTREPFNLLGSNWKCTEYMETEKTCVKYEMVVKK